MSDISVNVAPKEPVKVNIMAGVSRDANTLDGKHAVELEPAIETGTTAKYWRGDKAWQTLNQAAVAGLTTADDVIHRGPFVDVRSYASFSAAIDAIGASEKTLLIPNEQAVAADKTVPVNVTLKFLQGGSLNITDTKTVTINGHVEAGLYQIFKWTGTGKVVFGAGAVKEVYPQWWGAIGGSGATDDTAAIQAAANSLTSGGTLFFSVGTYKLTSKLTIGNIHLVGNGYFSTVLNFVGCDGIEAPVGTMRIEIKTLSIFSDSSPKTKTGLALLGTNADRQLHDTVKDCYFSGWNKAILADYCWFAVFENILIEKSIIGINFYNTSVNNSINSIYSVHDNDVGSKGIYLQASVDTTKKAEGIMISNSVLFGAKRAVDAEHVLALKVNNCILDYNYDIGVRLLGGSRSLVSNCWIAVVGAGVTGVKIENAEAAVNSSQKIINNHILGGGTALNGVFVGVNNKGCLVEGNAIEEFANSDIYSELSADYNIFSNNFLLSASPTFKNLFIGGDHNKAIGNTMPTFRLHDSADYNMVSGNTITDSVNCLIGAGVCNVIQLNIGFDPVNTWIAPTLLNGWVNFGSGYNPAGYYKDALGVVHLQGFIKDGTVGAADVFVLPVGYRPGYHSVFSIDSNDAFGLSVVYVGGSVRINIGNNANASLSGITFLAEN